MLWNRRALGVAGLVLWAAATAIAAQSAFDHAPIDGSRAAVAMSDARLVPAALSSAEYLRLTDQTWESLL
jgi:hypothetical protein